MIKHRRYGILGDQMNTEDENWDELSVAMSVTSSSPYSPRTEASEQYSKVHFRPHDTRRRSPSEVPTERGPPRPPLTSRVPHQAVQSDGKSESDAFPRASFSFSLPSEAKIWRNSSANKSNAQLRLEATLDQTGAILAELGLPHQQTQNAGRGRIIQLGKFVKEIKDRLAGSRVERNISLQAQQEAEAIVAKAIKFLSLDEQLEDVATAHHRQVKRPYEESEGAPWQHQATPTLAMPATRTQDDIPPKRRRTSDSGYSSDSPQTNHTFDTAPRPISPRPSSQFDLIASPREIDSFLDSLINSIHHDVLSNLCPDNMRGSFCKTPDQCILLGRHFACPEYAIKAKCPHEREGHFTHIGLKHTVRGCNVHHRTDCRKTHEDGTPCRVAVIYFHVRASCITLRGGKYCQTRPCQWGHDWAEVRRAVMRMA